MDNHRVLRESNNNHFIKYRGYTDKRIKDAADETSFTGCNPYVFTNLFSHKPMCCAHSGWGDIIGRPPYNT